MMSVQDTILKVENLSIALPDGGDRNFAVEDISFQVKSNEILCIVGESGSGKSVGAFAMMNLLPSVLKPSVGKIIFEGRDILKIPEKDKRKLRGNRMAMIFQEPMTALNPCYSVRNQIDEILKTHRNMTAAERDKKTISLLEEVRLPNPKSIQYAYPHQLSGGQRQRVIIAMALALDPKILIADEPTTALDVTTQAEILKLIKRLKTTQNAGIVFITHDFGVVAEIADRIIVMQQGHIVEHGVAEQVLNSPQHPYTKLLISSVPRRIIQTERRFEDKPVSMTATNVVKNFTTSGGLFRKGRTVQAVRDVSFEMRKSETLGIVGESGSGKTTLVRCLIRLINSNSGKIQINGINFAELNPAKLREQREDIQIIFQDPYGSLNPRRTIGDILVEGPMNFGVSYEEAKTRALELLQTVHMDPDCIDRYPSQFSGGQRQRICIARALAVRPKVLIADEAVSALDVSVQKEVLILLKEIRAKFDLTIIFITHDLRVAGQLCDRIIVMRDGKIVEEGTVNEVFVSPKNRYTQELLAAEPGNNWTIPEFNSESDFPTYELAD